MRDRKRKGKKAPIGPIQPHGPLSNGVGQTPKQAGNAALVRDQTMWKLDPEDRRVFVHLEQGYRIEEIALSLRQTIDWVEQRKKHISVVLGIVLVELQITL